MKKITLLLFCSLFSVAMLAQEQDFNRWSIEVDAGVHKPGRPFADGYYTTTPSFFLANLGARYMITSRFGVKLDAGYHQIEGNEGENGQGGGSLPFQTRYMRYSLQGVANLGDILNFRDWTQRINLLAHMGGGYSRLTPQEPVERETDQIGHIIVGLTPQLRISDRIALTGDLSMIGHVRQNFTWDGSTTINSRGFDGMMITGSVGLTFYLGSAEKHADWYSMENNMAARLDSLATRVEKIEDDMLDSDQDGVPNYLDQEPNTTNGVAVNTKGVAVDKNNNGIPDELEDDLDERYSRTTGDDMITSQSGLISDLLNKGYVNVYFKFDSTEPETYSLNAINMCIRYMEENPDAEADLIGYADEIGNPEYNNQLSEARAQKVYDIMTAAGIDGERLSIIGNGEDASVDKGSAPARQLVRRVTFKLK